MSEQEQRKYVLDYMQASKEYFTVKELVGKISKTNKKFREDVIEGVVTMLLDDRLIQKEKVGTLNVVWSFPADATRALRQRKQGLLDKCAAERTKQASLQERLEQSRLQCQESGEDRQRLQEVVDEMALRVSSKQEKLQALKSATPVDVHDKVRVAKQAKTATNRWIDNFYTLEGYFKSCFSGTTEDFYQSMNIASPPEYIE
ncbi:meiotic nuclear division protein 1 [Protomyces lactucae-debilis]|uniref:Meiotic nuclear division protein 1 n=1 Tax=Protomyces lactucae-debilis TaxID=2754530 RepID=A0A1Y2FWR3_PROLT|nr:meiotic nuclear division protein 1 [Protomyces lactucae-debilis]ORY87626.1 meiotic nuclear division protein 1 [Protomyces lactucae-debilis]